MHFLTPPMTFVGFNPEKPSAPIHYHKLSSYMISFFFYLASELLNQTSEIVETLLNNGGNETDVNITSLDVVFVADIISSILSVSDLSAVDYDDFLHTVNLLQNIGEDVLRLADETNDSVVRYL